MADAALEFDLPEMNVDLAEQYLKENEGEIKNIQLKKTNSDKWNYGPHLKRNILKKIIEENSELICQLEYVTNNTPIEVSKKNIQLMLQYLNLSKKYRATALGNPDDPVAIHKNTPLVLFMHAIDMGALTVCVERSAVCHLLLNLCEESGFINPKFKVSVSTGDTTGLYDTLGCFGIVSERSDLDSAVDAFLLSPSSPNCFWRLQKILVQESIFQPFKELIESKAKLKGTKTKEHEELKKFSSDSFVYENKVILFDFAGDVEALRLDGAHVIFIEAFRTNKELLSLIRERTEIGCVSLWCADVAEANEIAYNVPASLVWINDYANFDGPPEMSTILLDLFLSNSSCKQDVPKKIIDYYKTWKTYDNKKRASIISSALEKLCEGAPPSDEGRVTVYNMLKLLEQTSHSKLSAVEVADGKICVTLDCPVGLNYDDKSFEFDADILASLVIGNGVVCYNLTGSSNESLSLRRELERFGVPIWSINELTDSDETNTIKCHNYRFRTKVVLTNFGTIFAN